ncbi:GPI ethanolamine phosphate transferase 2 [Chrysoperla carnea]|uniref:GPI ethanolamine phosphate transferase 2 n=1 Tax=Chrysoperla carnea TaxID=189513 RepID=UPI001D07D321|nr:GPI ethanolamine phosphate transferase 2 [Chrysoperla carnea]
MFLFGLYVFFTAYFSTTIQNNSSHHHSKPNVPRKVHRSVIMVIDALREDLLNDSISMPFLNKQLNNKQGCLYSTKVELPTVTMPRIKALTTGTIPNFIDVLLNFESTKLHDDNILLRAVEDGQKIIFYGDETWIKLFPNIFLRSEGTTSFYVNDYTEVDNNVTRNLNTELEKQDWDIMILHYLGLDHIGHLEGPTSSLMAPKLLEMDNIISTIHYQLKQWETTVNKQSLFIITSDHGMKDSGGHGGSTHPEIMVPLVAIGVPCKGSSIAQIDVAPTLSVLFGVPFPKSSIGKLISNLLNLNQVETLSAFETYYNHLINIIPDSHHEFINDMNIRKSNAQTNIDNATLDKTFDQLYLFYKSEIERISDYLTSIRHDTFDVSVLWISTLVLWTTSLLTNKKINFDLEKYEFLIIIGCMQILQIISTLSSSYVEEEHHIWHFYNSTFLVLILYKLLMSKKARTKQLSRYSVLLILHRFIRELNVTYDSNLATWLYRKDSVIELSIMFIGGKYRIYFKNCVPIYVHMGISTKGSKEYFESWTLFILIFLNVIIDLYSNQVKNNAKYSYLHTFLLFWILLCTLLLRPHNVLLISGLILISYEINQTNISFNIRIILHYWLGKAFYFYQGTTNNIATVDVASGYIGQTSYNPLFVGILIFVHTYSMPVLSHVLLTINSIEHFKFQSITKLRYYVDQLHSINLLLTFSTLSFYCVAMILHRNHLFICRQNILQK